MLELGSKFLLSYFLGSIMGALVMGRLAGGVDIRTMGSGNAGGTNALRTQGWMFALGVMIIDVGKGMVATGLVPQLPIVTEEPAIARNWLTLACAAAAVIGHVWPLWHNFRGGKGAATLLGTFAVLAPWVLLPVLLVWAWMLVLFGYVGLATISAAAFAPLYLLMTRWPGEQALLVYTAVMALYILYAHRSNLLRMRAGTEHRHSSVMLFRKKRD
ncbi:MAG: glycerol-3-phosphate 1-O-acyltransferase PlsY [Woeseiaceae bacterium]|nr:glycerol-3-phosphate 1-O-acyltransferase PlsY [Woeseiaceae bacterium]